MLEGSGDRCHPRGLSPSQFRSNSNLVSQNKTVSERGRPPTFTFGLHTRAHTGPGRYHQGHWQGLCAWDSQVASQPQAPGRKQVERCSFWASDPEALIKEWQRCAQVSSVPSLGLDLLQAEQCPLGKAEGEWKLAQPSCQWTPPFDPTPTLSSQPVSVPPTVGTSFWKPEPCS